MKSPAAILGALVLLAACSSGPAASPPAALPTGVPTLTRAPASVALATPSSATATPSVPEATEFEQSPPPLGRLGVTGESGVDGLLGSWCYEAGCLDGLPPPKRDLPRLSVRAPGTDLSFVMPASAPFVAWSASYAEQSLADDFIPLDRGGPDDPSDPPADTPTLEQVTFAGPPAGNWVIRVSIWFPDGIGDATYYWHVVVD